MKSSAVYAAILLGTAATAPAQPEHQSAGPKKDESSERVSLKEHEARAKRNAPRAPSDWVEIASPTPAKHGTEFIVVGKDAGSFGRLRLDAAKGKVVIRRVKVYFDDGKVKVFSLNATIDRKRQPSTLVALGDVKAIDRVVVTTETHTNGEYAIYGSPTIGADTTR